MNGEPARDLDAERAVIGAVLHSGGRLLDRLDLTAEDFYHPAHAELWTLMHGLASAGDPVEAAAVLAVSERRQIHAAALIECVEAATASPDFYAEQLRGHTIRRRILTAALQLQQLVDSPAERDAPELVELARGIVDDHTRTGDAQQFADLDERLAASLERWCMPDTNVLPTGWLDLDEKLSGGLRPGHLTVVGARPAVGKSLLATELASAVASAGIGTLFSSLEMSAAEVVDRIAASRTKIGLATLTTGTANDDQMGALSRFATLARTWPLEIEDRPHVGVTAIRSRARDLTRRPRGLGLVIVDYLQLVAPADRRAPREQQVASVSRGLKLLARDLSVPVVALAQVNRGAASRDSKRPVMSDLRESGAIEADADEIWLLHRDDDQRPGELEVNVVKNRHGATGLIQLGWYPHNGRITNNLRGIA